MLETVLLPFGGLIIYDSFMGSHPIEFGGGVIDMFEDAKSEKRRRIRRLAGASSSSDYSKFSHKPCRCATAGL